MSCVVRFFMWQTHYQYQSEYRNDSLSFVPTTRSTEQALADYATMLYALRVRAGAHARRRWE